MPNDSDIYICNFCGKEETWSYYESRYWPGKRGHDLCWKEGRTNPLRPKSPPMNAFEQLTPEAQHLLKVSPGLPELAGMILRDTNLWLPDGLERTTESLTAWLREQTVAEPPEPEKPSTANAGEFDFALNVDVSETVSGTCRFSYTQTGSGTIHLETERLLELLDESDSYTEFKNLVMGDLEDRVGNDIEMEGPDDLNRPGYYDDFETTDYNDFSMYYNPDYLRQLLINFVWQFDRQKAEAWGLDAPRDPQPPF